MAVSEMQSPLIDSTPVLLEAPKKVPVPGRNPAYYTGPAPKDQLLVVDVLDILPYPPLLDQRGFAYLRGEVPHVKGLEKARFIWTTRDNSDDERSPYIVNILLSECPWVAIRQGGKGEQHYARELKPGKVEFIADYEVMSYFGKTFNDTIEIAIVLPDQNGEKVLTSFEGLMVIE